MSRPHHGWLLLPLALLSGCATTGTIRGTLRIPPDSRAAIDGPGSRPAVPPDSVTDAVIYVQEVREPAPDARRGRRPTATMRMRDHRFEPRVLAVAAGTRVRFENRDRVYHNVFSISPAKRFDAGKCAPRQSRAVIFDKEGVVQLYCEIDAAMAGLVFVVPHRAFTQPDATGAFVLRDLPRGKYSLRVWHPALGDATRQVDLDKDEVAVTLKF